MQRGVRNGQRQNIPVASGCTPHERGPEPVVSIAFCDMSQNVTKRLLTQPVVVFSPAVESENLKVPKLHFTKTGFAVSFGLD